MNWLNLETNELRAPEFLAATAMERGVWLSLLLHCVSVENNGRLQGAVKWTQRQWMVVCGLEANEVMNTTTELWRIEGEDVLVWGYPHSVQRGLEARRENGRKGGRPGKTEADNRAGNPSKTGEETRTKPGDNLTGTIREGKGKGKVREKEGKAMLPGAGAPAEEELPLAKGIEKAMAQALRWSPLTGWEGLTPDLITELGQAFPACDIVRQFGVMALWLQANPAKARKSNWRRFAVNWLTREQDKGGDLGASSQGFGPKKNGGGGAAASLMSPTGTEPEWDWRQLYAEIWGAAPVVGWFELAKSVRHELRTAWAEKNGKGGAA